MKAPSVCLLGLLLVFMIPTPGYAATVEYIHTDALGSPVAVTDSNGQVIERREYESYGRQLTPATITNGPGFTGHVQDAATGLTYMQQRYYDPGIGRFLSVDPVTAHSIPGSNFNRYWYANDNPYKFTDPDGRLGCAASRIASACASQGMGTTHVRSALDTGPNAQASSGSGIVGKSSTHNIYRGPPNEPLEPVVPEALVFPALKGLTGFTRAMEAIYGVKDHTAVIGRVKDLQNLRPGEKSLLDRLPNRGNPQANWRQNSGVLRQEMGKGRPIRDASPGDTGGAFLNAERGLLQERGWVYNARTEHWVPPAP